MYGRTNRLLPTNMYLRHHAGDVNVDHFVRMRQWLHTACRPIALHVVKRLLSLEVAMWCVDSVFSLEPAELTNLANKKERAWLALGLTQYDPTDAEKKAWYFLCYFTYLWGWFFPTKHPLSSTRWWSTTLSLRKNSCSMSEAPLLPWNNLETGSII